MSTVDAYRLYTKLIFSIAMGADYSFDIKSGFSIAPAFSLHNNFDIASVCNKVVSYIESLGRLQSSAPKRQSKVLGNVKLYTVCYIQRSFHITSKKNYKVRFTEIHYFLLKNLKVDTCNR